MNFDYKEAFQRNIGLITEDEQEKVGHFTIAIAGMGAVGGAHAIALVRQGFQHFRIADPDVYELKNFNRQYGAKVATLGRKKVDVMREEMLAINPNCQIEIFSGGVTDENLDRFISGADLSVDGIDAFEVEVRRKFYNRSLELNIPVVGAGPIGFGTSFVMFMPGGPSYDDYFAVNESTPYMQKMLSFAVGIAPALLQRKYMKKVSFKERRAPSSAGAVNLCAGIVAIYALKILLHKGPIKAAPHYHQFDVMTDRYVSRRMWLGNRNPIQRLKMMIASRLILD